MAWRDKPEPRRNQAPEPRIPSPKKLRSESDGDATRWIMDAASDSAVLLDRQGVIIAANPPFAALVESHMDDLCGHSIYEFFPSQAAPRREAIAARVLQAKEPVEFETMLWPDRTFRARVHPMLDEAGQVRRIAVFISDITAWKAAERERFRLASAIEQAGEAFMILSPEFIIEYVNQSFEAMTGYSLRQACGHDVAMLYKGESQIQALQDIRHTLLDGETWTGKTWNTRRDGSRFQSEKTLSPIRGRYGVLLGYVSIWRDVTEMEELDKQLRHAQKMEAFGTLAGGIAHDFNNILSPIVLHAEMGTSHCQGDEACQRSFGNILQAALRAKDLVDQILKLSRRTEGDEPVVFQLGAIAKECLKLMKPGLPPTVRTAFLRSTDDDTILADPAQCHQVLMNLCTNAVHAMQDTGGELRIEIRDLTIDEMAPAVTRGEGHTAFLICTVRDTGHGIPPDMQDKIFDPFFTTKKAGIGTGLGLSVVHGIVTGLGGSIKVRSTPDRGTAFHVFLPKAVSRFQCIQDAESASEIPRGSGRLLLADDDPVMVATGKELLSELGYVVSGCATGEEALSRFAATPAAWDLAIVNMAMPGMHGMQLATRLAALRPDLPILFTSGGAPPENGFGYTGAARTDFLKKPFRTTELAQAVRRCLECEDEQETEEMRD